MFNEKLFKTNPVAYFRENGWVLTDENKESVLIALSEIIGEDPKSDKAIKVGKMLAKLATYNPDLRRALIDGAKKANLAEECERDKKRKRQIEFNDYALTQGTSSKLKKALAVLCMVWAVQGLAPALPVNNNNIKASTVAVSAVNENKIGDKKMDLRTFLMEASGCYNKGAEFDADKFKKNPVEYFRENGWVLNNNKKEIIDAMFEIIDENGYSDKSLKAGKMLNKLASYNPGLRSELRALAKKSGVTEEVNESVVEEGVVGGVILGLLGFAAIKNIILPLLAKGFIKFSRNFMIKNNKVLVQNIARRIIELYSKNTGMDRSEFRDLVLNDKEINKNAASIEKASSALSDIKRTRMKNSSFGSDPLETIRDLNKGIYDSNKVIEQALNELFKAEDEAKKEQAARKFKGKNLIRKVTAIEQPEECGECGDACAAGAKKFKKETCCPQCGKDFKHCTCER